MLLAVKDGKCAVLEYDSVHEASLARLLMNEKKPQGHKKMRVDFAQVLYVLQLYAMCVSCVCVCVCV